VTADLEWWVLLKKRPHGLMMMTMMMIRVLVVYSFSPRWRRAVVGGPVLAWGLDSSVESRDNKTEDTHRKAGGDDDDDGFAPPSLPLSYSSFTMSPDPSSPQSPL